MWGKKIPFLISAAWAKLGIVSAIWKERKAFVVPDDKGFLKKSYVIIL